MNEIEKLCCRHQAQFLPKICDWMLSKNYLKTIGYRFKFPSFRHRVILSITGIKRKKLDRQCSTFSRLIPLML